MQRGLAICGGQSMRLIYNAVGFVVVWWWLIEASLSR